MHEKITPFFIRTISSLHAGSGDDNGLVDLPIQRELVTSYPKIEASTLKGAIRSRVEQLGADHTKVHLAFGYDEKSNYQINTSFSGSGDSDSYAQQFMGALAFTDARLLFFPVRSMKGTFALVTCPYVLRRFTEDLALEAIDNDSPNSNIKTAIEAIDKLTTGGLGVDTKNNIGKCYSMGDIVFDASVILEEYRFDVQQCDALPHIYAALCTLISPSLCRKIVIVDDDVFSDFTQLFTERITRNKIKDDTGTVEEGGLFTEEYLPPEAVLYSLAMANEPFQPKERDNDLTSLEFKSVNKVMSFITTDAWNKAPKKVLQIGGNTTVGKGIVELTFAS